MAIINQYKAIYPIENSFDDKIYYINATSMEKAIHLISIDQGIEPKIISKQIDNVLTENTEENLISFEIKSYYILDDEEIEIPNCIAYPSSLNNCNRGNTIYMQSPESYEFIENEIPIKYTFLKWIYNNTDYIENPQKFVLPLDESIDSITVKAIYEREII